MELKFNKTDLVNHITNPKQMMIIKFADETNIRYFCSWIGNNGEYHEQYFKGFELQLFNNVNVTQINS